MVSSIRFGEDIRQFELGAFVVMPNHVHLLITPHMAPSRLMQLLKGVTARAANKILGRTGETFWQKESYDHYVRKRGGVPSDSFVHREQSGCSRAGSAAFRFSLVQRDRREDSRRCTLTRAPHPLRQGLISISTGFGFGWFPGLHRGGA